jgi:radical SAM protein with 4Fe4S-binding SPASM domain
MAKGFNLMSELTLTRIADEIKRIDWNSRIEIAMHGEPTYNPDFSNFVKILRNRLPRTYIMMLTNGFGLRKNASFKLAELIGSGINCIGIERYAGCPWAEDIEAQLKEANAESAYPDLIKHYPECGPEGNPHQRFMGSRIVFINAIDKETNGTHASLCNHCGAAAPKNDLMAGKRCARPFREMSIRWDGWVALCCNDFRGEYRVGNINEVEIDNIWHSPRFEAARKKLYHGQRDFIPCQGCDHRSYRSGLLPDKCGKKSLPLPDGSEEAYLKAAIGDGPLSEIVKRPWET